MLSSNCIEKLIDLQDLEVKNIKNSDEKIEIYCNLTKKPQKCPSCGETTSKIHDYRKQTIKDISSFGKKTYLIFSKRRYRCDCGKRFPEKNTFLPKYYRMTRRMVFHVIDQLRCETSFTQIAKQNDISVSTAIRIFDNISYPTPKLPEVVAIDEFKGNAGTEKYQTIITDPKSKIVLDILPKRYEYYLSSYFKDMERSHVEYFISDMWKPFRDIGSVYFKNAKHVIDRYHWIRQAIWAFESVRKEVQKQFSLTHRRYFKRSKSLLLKQFDYLNDEQKQEVNIMLYASPTLSTAYYLKNDLLSISRLSDKAQAKKRLLEWIDWAGNSSIPSFEKCAKTYYNWFEGIVNSFGTVYTNGFTEGCNNKIKVLKRNAYGYRNFRRFRNRILHMFAYQKQAAT